MLERFERCNACFFFSGTARFMFVSALKMASEARRSPSEEKLGASKDLGAETERSPRVC